MNNYTSLGTVLMTLAIYTLLSFSAFAHGSDVLGTDDKVSNSYLSCKLARDLRRKDIAKSLSAFEFYTLNKMSLAELADDYSVDGLTVAKVKQFCERVEQDLQRSRALSLYDRASKACRDSRTALNDGGLNKAKQYYAEYEQFLSQSESTAPEVLQLERGSLQWRQCQSLKQDIASFDSGKLKAARDQLDHAYSRCLPIWSELSTQKVSSLPASQISAELSSMQVAQQQLTPLIAQLNVDSLSASLQEFGTCIDQVKQGLPAQYVEQRIVALQRATQSCGVGIWDNAASTKARQLLQAVLPEQVLVNEQQAQILLDAEQSLLACVEARQGELSIDNQQRLILDQGLEQESLDTDTSVEQGLLAE